MNNIKAIVNSDKTCFKCLKDFDDLSLHKIKIPSMGYGSGFDGWSTKVHLCDGCIQETNQEWWKLEIIKDEYDWHSYKHEDDIFEFIERLPVESRELFWNRYSTDNYMMESQDWIDYELGLLSHYKCKEYGYFSFQEIKAYEERFPICNHVGINIYEDGSKGSSCFWGAFGNEDGDIGINISNKCYNCTHFILRDGEIMTVDMKLFEVHRTKRQIEDLTIKLAKLMY